MIGLTSRRITRIPHLKKFFNDADYAPVNHWNKNQFSQIAGWGLKPSGLKARKIARSLNLPCLLLEDGFLRSVTRSAPPLSLIIDSEGIYYDATRPSTFDSLVQRPLTTEQSQRTHHLMAMWRDTSLSKYNLAHDYENKLPDRFVLVIDQVKNDCSISAGLADAASFQSMLDAALRDNPDCLILIKSHPDTLNGQRAGHFLDQAHASQRIHIIKDECASGRLIKHAKAIYTVTSQIGFEALIYGQKVHVFGMPFYAGRGLTIDHLSPPEWRRPITLEQLVHSALVRYPRYINPETGKLCEIETVITFFAQQIQMRKRYAKKLYAWGFSYWKRPILRLFLSGSKIIFTKSMREIPAGSTLAVWGDRFPETLPPDIKLLHIEDGFIRSRGLGVELTKPLSWICDDLGLHYNPQQTSRLEHILATTTFDDALLQRAERLRRTIILNNITKYNTGGTQWQRPDNLTVLLVAGQVETDASLLYGADLIRTDYDLLREVRGNNPQAWIVYKPHPDTVAGLRKNLHQHNNLSEFYNEILPHADTASLLNSIDEVHTITSQTGFEALIRGKRVICYGQPFYAGWGLTIDMIPCHRRTRRLTIPEIVAGALILYPTYFNYDSKSFTTIERVIDIITSQQVNNNDTNFLWKSCMRSLLRLINSIWNSDQRRRVLFAMSRWNGTDHGSRGKT